MTRKYILMVAVALLSAGCGSAQAPQHHHAAATAPSAAVLTDAQGEQICNDLTAWAARNVNANMPRFDATMTSDEQEAAGTQLGTDLLGLDNDLQAENATALMPGPPGYPTDLSALQADCSAYGVNFQGWNSK